MQDRSPPSFNGSALTRAIPPPPRPESAPPDRVGQLLARLQPGLPRTEVERTLGAAAVRISPVNVRDNKVTYTATYELAIQPAARDSDYVVVTIEYDATQPGHTLLSVQVVLSAT
ncbi:hypothetical protein R5W23_005972 [Gemmata sp. JC673]|uniref:Uncharacterized protein n=1 Tax=Gemmata algarum TaxID=2975278 RepID=A0ABU5EUG5_9BACT|nr:hypothetical protein [Gemmata algarum]MDY3558815.1 hypothetical protein [Gemmata algarum]